VEAPETRRDEGNGLGLSISKSLVEILGGNHLNGIGKWKRFNFLFYSTGWIKHGFLFLFLSLKAVASQKRAHISMP